MIRLGLCNGGSIKSVVHFTSKLIEHIKNKQKNHEIF